MSIITVTILAVAILVIIALVLIIRMMMNATKVRDAQGDYQRETWTVQDVLGSSPRRSTYVSQ